MSASRLLVAPLFDGPLDIIGDIHGEIDALSALLSQLGYSNDGRHPDSRRLVFLGDLVDRGPDSPAVLKQVRSLVESGRAQCLLGNHELNLLLDDEKYGNSWWTAPEKPTTHPARRISPQEKADLLPFLSSLPLALERDDLRVVHACWDSQSISALKDIDLQDGNMVEIYRQFVRQAIETMRSQGLFTAVNEEWRDVKPRIEDQDWEPVYMPAKAELDSRVQMDNPIAVLTSGAERPAGKPFWAGGKWRMADRVKWWEEYDEQIPVIMGHYWRRFGEAKIYLSDKYGPDLFAGIGPHHWMGKRDNVYCVDFSVGARAEQRAQNQDEYACKLAALRVPEWEVLHDDGERAMLET